MNPLLIVVDDDIDDIEFISQAAKEVNPDCDLKYFLNGIEFLEYYKHIQNIRRTIAVTIDINMPKLSGMELLNLLRDKGLINIAPVYVVTTANPLQHEKQCLKLGAKRYFTKPVREQEWKKIVQEILNTAVAH